MQPYAVKSFDTDRFGTFSGEKERPGNAFETAKLKAEKAHDEHNASLVLVSEGSFVPHPSNPFATADIELLLISDHINHCVFRYYHISSHTNFSSIETKHWSEVQSFAKSAQFPSHALIVKSKNLEVVQKGITSELMLEDAFQKVISLGGNAIIETDMRAHLNPTRMEVIKEAMQVFAQKLLKVCPSCSHPMFDINEKQAGLPCMLCGMPTRITQFDIAGCEKCGHTEKYASLEKWADPAHCDACNP
jgi:Zn finger protein HypA/HybF involved in hydrogenase expression